MRFGLARGLNSIEVRSPMALQLAFYTTPLALDPLPLRAYRVLFVEKGKLTACTLLDAEPKVLQSSTGMHTTRSRTLQTRLVCETLTFILLAVPKLYNTYDGVHTEWCPEQT